MPGCSRCGYWQTLSFVKLCHGCWMALYRAGYFGPPPTGPGESDD